MPSRAKQQGWETLHIALFVLWLRLAWDDGRARSRCGHRGRVSDEQEMSIQRFLAAGCGSSSCRQCIWLPISLHETALIHHGTATQPSQASADSEASNGMRFGDENELTTMEVLLEILDKHDAHKTVDLNFHGGRDSKVSCSPVNSQLYRYSYFRPENIKLLSINVTQQLVSSYQRRSPDLWTPPVNRQICGSERVRTKTEQ
jgi:hypothetical protein